MIRPTAAATTRNGYMRYLHMTDVGEALAHELALVALDKNGKPTRKPPSVLWEERVPRSVR
jgi:hypothetical protein